MDALLEPNLYLQRFPRNSASKTPQYLLPNISGHDLDCLGLRDVTESGYLNIWMQMTLLGSRDVTSRMAIASWNK